MTEPRYDQEPEPPIDGLEAWAREPEPSPALEALVFETLRGEGLVGQPRRSSWLPLAALLAVALAAGFLAGTLASRTGEPALEAADHRPRFLLLLYEDESYRSAEPGHEAERVREYAAWAAQPHGNVSVVGGEKLADDGVSQPGVSRPATDTHRHLAGFFELRAGSREEALRVAQTCPHVKYGGTVELREIEPPPP